MDATDFQERVQSIKSAFDADTEKLVGDIARCREKITKWEGRLESLKGELVASLNKLAMEFAGVDASAGTTAKTQPGPGNDLQRLRERLRARRGSLDEPMLQLAREMGAFDFTASQLLERWNERNPDSLAERSTVRGVLERLVENKQLDVTHQGGRGSENPRRYKPVPRGISMATLITDRD